MKKWIGIGIAVLILAYTAYWWKQEESAEKTVKEKLNEWKEGSFSYEKIEKGGFPLSYALSIWNVSLLDGGQMNLRVEGPLTLSSPVFGHSIVLATDSDVAFHLDDQNLWKIHGKKEGVLVADWKETSFLSPSFLQLFETNNWLPNFRSFSIAMGEMAIEHAGEKGFVGPSRIFFQLDPIEENGKHAALDLDVSDIRFEGEVKEPESYTFQSWVEELIAPSIFQIAPLSFKGKAESMVSDWQAAWMLIDTHTLPEKLTWDFKLEEWKSNNRFQEQGGDGVARLVIDEQNQEFSVETEGYHHVKKAFYERWMALLQMMKDHPEKITTTTPFENRFKKGVQEMWPLVVESIPKFHEWKEGYSRIKFNLAHRMTQESTWNLVIDDCSFRMGPFQFSLKGHAEEGLGVYLVHLVVELKSYKTLIRSLVEEYQRVEKFMNFVDSTLSLPRLKDGATDRLIQFFEAIADKPGEDLFVTIEHNEKNKWKIGKLSEEEVVAKIQQLDLVIE